MMTLPARLRRPAYLVAGGLFLASFLLYLSTLAPSVVALFDDSLEFQLVIYQLGIAHPTGYPFYILLGKLFTLLPVGNVAYRVNLMSAVFGALTVALLYLLILRLLPPYHRSRRIAESNGNGPNVRPIEIQAEPILSSRSLGLDKSAGNRVWLRHVGAIIGAVLLAVGQVFWQQATVAEVYTLNAFFVALLLWVTISLSSQAEIGIWRLAFVAGLALTHHRTILLLLPALLVYLFLVYGSHLLKPKTILLSIVFGLLPLLLYLYLPWRGHVGSLDGTYQNTWPGFWRQVSASGYGLFIFENPFGQEQPLSFYWNLLADQFYTTVPGLIGLAYLLRQRSQRKILALTGTAFLTYFIFNLFYKVADIAVFFIPVFLIWAVWSGLGAAFLLETAAMLKYPAWRLPATALFLLIFAFMFFQLFQANRAGVSQGYTWQIHDYGIDMLRQPLAPEEKPAVVGILGEMTLLRYFQQTEKLRPDIETIAADLEAERLAVVEKLLSQGRTVYLTRELPGAAARWSLSAVGPLVRVNPAPLNHPPAFAITANQAVTPEITLLGYTPSRTPYTGQGPAPLRLSLVWQVNGPIPADLKVSARLLNPEGAAQAVVDAAPVHFAYPTTAWRPGEMISDVYDLALPAETPPGQYTPLIIWYDPAQNAAEAGRIMLNPVILE
jgi:hypothetical protein